jgi:hypothetical protein
MLECPHRTELDVSLVVVLFRLIPLMHPPILIYTIEWNSELGVRAKQP